MERDRFPRRAGADVGLVEARRRRARLTHSGGHAHSRQNPTIQDEPGGEKAQRPKVSACVAHDFSHRLSLDDFETVAPIPENSRKFGRHVKKILCLRLRRVKRGSGDSSRDSKTRSSVPFSQFRSVQAFPGGEKSGASFLDGLSVTFDQTAGGDEKARILGMREGRFGDPFAGDDGVLMFSQNILHFRQSPRETAGAAAGSTRETGNDRFGGVSSPFDALAHAMKFLVGAGFGKLARGTSRRFPGSASQTGQKFRFGRKFGGERRIGRSRRFGGGDQAVDPGGERGIGQGSIKLFASGGAASGQVVAKRLKVGREIGPRLVQILGENVQVAGTAERVNESAEFLVEGVGPIRVQKRPEGPKQRPQPSAGASRLMNPFRLAQTRRRRLVDQSTGSLIERFREDFPKCRLRRIARRGFVQRRRVVHWLAPNRDRRRLKRPLSWRKTGSFATGEVVRLRLENDRPCGEARRLFPSVRPVEDRLRRELAARARIGFVRRSSANVAPRPDQGSKKVGFHRQRGKKGERKRWRVGNWRRSIGRS